MKDLEGTRETNYGALVVGKCLIKLGLLWSIDRQLHCIQFYCIVALGRSATKVTPKSSWMA